MRKSEIGLISLAIIGTLFAGAVAAQTVDDIARADLQNIRLAQASQERIDGVVDETRSLLDQYTRVNKEIDGLEVYNALMDRQVADQVEEMQKLSESIDQVTVIERQIMPLMFRMIDGLEKFIALDVPFLLQERNDRVARLRDLMERSDITVAEKFRNVFEAFQIENDYGRTIETYTAELEIDGGKREVEFLRIGRVALLYQSIDGAHTGMWDKQKKMFEQLDSGVARSNVRRGLRMAHEEEAPDLLLLPIDAPEAAQ